MPRSKNKVASRAKRKKVLDMAKGNFGRRKNVYTVAKNTVEKGLQHAYVGRKLKKREFRGLWIQRINAAARLNGISYSVLMSQLKKGNIELDRKALAEIAYTDAAAFTAIVNKVK
ncbi:MAG TPA: 50S ribosomal protein L20 [Flavobacteriales bacterium]|nr:50S ribosomal protein L20 [Flavobacteriales bacterium]